MKIASLEYNPAYKSNQNYNNKQQNAPAFKGTIVGKLMKGFAGEDNCRELSEIMEQFGSNLARKESEMKRSCTVTEPVKEVTPEGISVIIKFGEGLNKIAENWVNGTKGLTRPGMSFDFIADQHSNLPSDKEDGFISHILRFIFG